MQKISIISSFACLWLTGFLNSEFQNFVGFFLIFSVGILHGANDLKIFMQLNSKKNKKSVLKLLIYYLLVVFVGITMFAIMPGIALLLFVLASAYHFGEQHWSFLAWKNPTNLQISYYYSYGIFILLLLFHFNKVEVQTVIASISGISVPTYLFDYLLTASTLVLASAALFFTIKNSKFQNAILEQIVVVIVVTILFKITNLIWGFAIYFIFWHSIPSLYEQITYLYKEFTFKNAIRYFKSAFGYWIISLIGIFLLYYVLKETILFEAVFFSFLAAITFPHVFVILKMFKNKSDTENKISKI